MATISAAIQLHDNMSPALRTMNRALTAVLNSFEAMESASGHAVDTSSIRQARSELERTEIAISEMTAGLNQADRAQRQLNSDIRDGGDASNGLLSKIKGIAAAIGGIVGIGQIIGLSDEMSNYTARLDLINDGTQTTAELNNKIMQSANNVGASYQTVVDTVGRLGIVAGDAFDSNDEIIKFAEILNQHFAIAGTSAEGVDAAMLQISQAMGAGALRGEELNSVMEQAPTIIAAIADHLGVAKGKIKEMASEGQITADIVKEALFSTAEDTQAKFSRMPATFSTVWTLIKNKLLATFQPILQSIGGLAQKIYSHWSSITPVFDKLGAGVQALFEKLTIAATWAKSHWTEIKQIFSEIGSVISRVAGIVGSLLTAAFNTLGDAIKWAYDNWSILKPIIVGVTAAMATYTAGTKICQAAQWVLAGGLKTLILGFKELFLQMLKNPITLIAAAIGIIIAAIYSWVESVGGIKNAWIICVDNLGSAWDWMKTKFFQVVNFAIDTWDSFGLVTQKVTNAVIGFFGDMKAKVLGYIESMVNGAIDKINGLISWINKIPGVSISGVNHVTFGTEAAASNAAAKAQRAAELTAKQSQADSAAAARAAEIDDRKAAAEEASKSRLSKIVKTQSYSGAGLTQVPNPMKNQSYSGTGLIPISSLMFAQSYSGQNNYADAAAMADTLNDLDADLSYLLDLRERDVIEHTLHTITVNQTNNNNINSELDIDGVMRKWTDEFTRILEIGAEGVYM